MSAMNACPVAVADRFGQRPGEPQSRLVVPGEDLARQGQFVIRKPHGEGASRKTDNIAQRRVVGDVG